MDPRRPCLCVSALPVHVCTASQGQAQVAGVAAGGCRCRLHSRHAMLVDCLEPAAQCCGDEGVAWRCLVHGGRPVWESTVEAVWLPVQSASGARWAAPGMMIGLRGVPPTPLHAARPSATTYVTSAALSRRRRHGPALQAASRCVLCCGFVLWLRVPGCSIFSGTSWSALVVIRLQKPSSVCSVPLHAVVGSLGVRAAGEPHAEVREAVVTAVVTRRSSCVRRCSGCPRGGGSWGSGDRWTADSSGMREVSLNKTSVCDTSGDDTM
eukprot:jgi/Ulvmu1/3421/UM016_0040.1